MTDPLTQNGYNYASNNPINMMDPYGMFSIGSAWSGFQSLTGLDKYQAAIAGGCSWGAITSSGGMAILDMGTLLPGAGEVDLEGQVAVRGLMGAVKAEKAARAAEEVVQTSELTTDVWKQNKLLSPGEIKMLEQGGEHPHEIKGKNSAGLDLFKDVKGNIYIQPKSGGMGTPTGLNINDF